MTCKDIENKLIFYIEKNLSDDENKKIAQHLQHCQECQAKYNFLTKNFEFIELEKQINANPFVAAAIVSKIDTTQSHKKIQAIKILQPVAIAAMLILAVLLGKITGNLYNSVNSENITQTYQPDEITDYAIADIPYSEYYFVAAQ